MKEITITLEDWEIEIIEFIKNGYNSSQNEEVVEDEDVIHGIFASFVGMKAEQAEEAIAQETMVGSGPVH